MASNNSIPLVASLVPRPQRLELRGGGSRLPPAVAIHLAGSDPLIEQGGNRLRGALNARKIRCTLRRQGPSEDEFIAIGIDPGMTLPAQGYRLRVARNGIRITGVDPAGAFYGVVTLVQCLKATEAFNASDSSRLPDLEIVDWPDVPIRGVLLDVSRDRVPTMETLFELADRLAAWKINQLQLYTEHAFAYRGHETVWKGASPLTCEEVRELDTFCRLRGVELVANQNSFGHFHRWLIHDPYRALAECPQGVRHPFSERTEPFSLCPLDPAAVDLLADLYDQLLPCFSSSLVNVGLDETFDLGMGRSAAACERRGRGTVYLEFLHRVHDLVAAREHRMQFWADMVSRSPAMLERLPTDVVALEWGYEADHPYRERCRALSAAGLDFYVCPGTSSWCSLAGRGHNAVGNLAGAALAGREFGASGCLITDWGDFGHLQPLVASYLGLLTGAALTWNTATAQRPSEFEDHLPESLDLHAFDQPGSGLGSAAVELADVYRRTGTEVRNGSVLFYLLLAANDTLELPRFRRLEPAGLRRAAEHLERSLSRLDECRPANLGAELGARELRWVARMLRFACRLGLRRLELGSDSPLSDLDGAARGALRAEISPLVDEYAWLWSQRSREGGFSDSVRRLERVRDLLA